MNLASDTSNYRLENTCLISKNYEELQSKEIEDALRGLQEPCTVESIVMELGLNAKDVEGKVLALVKRDAEIGRILSGGKLFVPERYVR